MKVTKSQLMQIIKEEFEAVTTEGNFVQDYDEIDAEEYEQFQVDQAAQAAAQEPTNMNRNLREFAEWVLDIDGHIESLSGEHVTADEIPSDINLYDMWLSGMSPDQVAQDLTTRDY